MNPDSNSTAPARRSARALVEDGKRVDVVFVDDEQCVRDSFCMAFGRNRKIAADVVKLDLDQLASCPR